MECGCLGWCVVEVGLEMVLGIMSFVYTQGLAENWDICRRTWGAGGDSGEMEW